MKLSRYLLEDDEPTIFKKFAFDSLADILKRMNADTKERAFFNALSKGERGEQICLALINNFGVDINDDSGEFDRQQLKLPFIFAIDEWNWDMAIYMITNGLKINKQIEGTQGRQSYYLIEVVWKAPYHIIQAMLKNKANPAVRDSRGDTPLHKLIKDRESLFKLDIFKELYKYGIDLDAQNDLKQTPMMIAVANSDFDTVDLLLRLGADPFVKDKDENTASDLASLKMDHEQERIYNLLKVAEGDMETNIIRSYRV